MVALAVRVIDPTTGARSWLLGWIDPKTGLWVQQAVTPGSDTGAHLFTHVEPGTTNRRTATVRLGIDGPSHVWTYGSLGTTSSAELLSGLPPSTGELPGSSVATLVPYGMSASSNQGFEYRRPPNATQSIPCSLDRKLTGVAGYSADNFAVFVFSQIASYGQPGSLGSRQIHQVSHGCSCTSGVSCCDWSPLTFIGYLYQDPFETGPAPAYATISDPLASTQVMRTSDATWVSTESWGQDALPGERSIETAQVSCTGSTGEVFGMNPFPETSFFAARGSVTMTRTSSDTEIIVASASPPTFGASVEGFVRLRRVSCPPTAGQVSGYTELSLPSFQRAPGAALMTAPPVAAPVAGVRPGVLYVISPGALRYVE